MAFFYNAGSAREAGYTVRNISHTAYLSDDQIAKVITDAGGVMGYMSGLKATPTMKMAADKTITGRLNSLNKFLSKLVNSTHRLSEKRHRLISFSGDSFLQSRPN